MYIHIIIIIPFKRFTSLPFNRSVYNNDIIIIFILIEHRKFSIQYIIILNGNCVCEFLNKIILLIVIQRFKCISMYILNTK